MRNLFFTLVFMFIGTFSLAQTSCACGSGSGTVTANCDGDCYCNSTDGGCSCGCIAKSSTILVNSFASNEKNHSEQSHYRVSNCGIMNTNFIKGVRSIVIEKISKKNDDRKEKAFAFFKNYLNI